MLIYLTSIILPAVLAITGSLTFWRIHYAYEFYIPLILYVGGFIFMLLFWFLALLALSNILGMKKEPKKVSKIARFFLNDGMRCIDLLAGAYVKIIGKNKMPKNERFLFVQNHTSRFDPMITNGYFFKSDIAFITKEGNAHVPIFKKLMPLLFYQVIDREDPIQSLGVMRRSIELIENNVTSIGVYPEGTRHADAVLGDFHEGVFNICLKAKCPLVVTVIKNANKIQKNFPLRLTRVTLEIIDVIPYEAMESKTAKALSDEVHALMLEHLNN